jgi:putative membrane protein
MRKTILLGTIAILGIALTACEQNTASTTPSDATQTQSASTEPAPGTRNETTSAAKDAVAGAVGQLSAQLTSSTKGFVEGVAMSDMYEVEASKIALQRGQSQDVKKFAQQMVDAHTMTTDALKGIVSKANLQVDMPAQLDARHQGLIDDLKGAKAADFDGRFISQQSAAHEEAQILLRGYADSGDNPDLKSFAQMTLPKVQMHLDMISSIETAHKTRKAENTR